MDVLPRSTDAITSFLVLLFAPLERKAQTGYRAARTPAQIANRKGVRVSELQEGKRRLRPFPG